MMIHTDSGAAMPINETKTADIAKKPAQSPGPRPAICAATAAEHESICPHKKAMLQTALSDSYSGAWVNDKTRLTGH